MARTAVIVMYKVDLFQYKSQFYYVLNVKPGNQGSPVTFLNRLLVQNGMSVMYFGPFLRTLQRKDGRAGGREGDGYHVQDGAIAHMLIVLNKLFADRLMSHRLWPAKPPCDLCLWGNLEIKVYLNPTNLMN
jgi:hypothetical protein